MQNPSEKPGSKFPWPLVFLLLIVFWPAGMFLLGLKLRGDRAKQLEMGPTLSIAGIVVCAVFTLVLVFQFFSPRDAGAKPGSPAVFVVFLIGGILLARKGASLSRRRALVQQYITLVVNQGNTSIDAIAGILNRPDIAAVTAEIAELIAEGFLPGYRIDPGTRTVTGPAGASQTHGPHRVAFTCRNCGANNVVLTAEAFACCAYCGTAVRS